MSSVVFFSPPSVSRSPQFPYSSNSMWNVYTPTFSLNPITLQNSELGVVPLSKLIKAHRTNSPSRSTSTNDGSDNVMTIKEIPESTKPFSPDPFSSFSSGVKMPTAPWMKGPLLLEPNQVLDLSKSRNMKKTSGGKHRNPDRALTDKVSGARGKHAMRKIFKGIEKLKNTQKSEETQNNPEKVEAEFSFGDLWGDKDSSDVKWSSEKCNKLVFERRGKEKLEGTQGNSERIDLDIFSRDIGENGDLKSSGKMPWEREEMTVFTRPKKKKIEVAAELTLDRVFFERLRSEAANMRKWIKVKKAGVTQAVVDQIHLIWKNNELAMLKFDLPLYRNMDRAREILELKTGGLVVWSKKDALVIYRGHNYQFGSKTLWKMRSELVGSQEISFSNEICEKNVIISHVKPKGNEPRFINENILVNGSLYEREADRLLDGLGPRFVDWWYPKPFPVDADLLPEVVPGFKSPYRLCPPRARSKLSNDELTYLRKLARPLPTHFVLGRNRKLQGLAAAILKLWEKCHIAKIAVKWGIPNTDNMQMADELKSLTGGVLLLRNKFIIILYRGKDFLPRGVASLVMEREMELRRCQLQEESARVNAVESFYPTDETSLNTGMVGTLSEFQDIQSECRNLIFGGEVEVQLKAEKEKLEKELRNQERKLFILKRKIERSTKELLKLNSSWRPAEPDVDQEFLTEEERECLRKIGLKMDGSLLLGRRGVFDGLIEGLHQHWKHREVVNVISMQRRISQVIYTAKILEAESGGILVSVDKLKEGHAIIIYRGKNYKRPVKLVSQSLLNKKEALNRSLEMQRIGSLKFFAYQRQKTISDLSCKLAELQRKEIVEE